MRAITSYDYADRPSTLDVEGLGGTLMQSIVTSASYLPAAIQREITLINQRPFYTDAPAGALLINAP